MKNTKNSDQVPKEPAAQNRAHDELQCPRCGHRFAGAHQCPRCGYSGYFPISDDRAKRIRWILYPIFLVAALLVYFLVVRRNGG